MKRLIYNVKIYTEYTSIGNSIQEDMYLESVRNIWLKIIYAPLR